MLNKTSTILVTYKQGNSTFIIFYESGNYYLWTLNILYDYNNDIKEICSQDLPYNLEGILNKKIIPESMYIHGLNKETLRNRVEFYRLMHLKYIRENNLDIILGL